MSKRACMLLFVTLFFISTAIASFFACDYRHQLTNAQEKMSKTHNKEIQKLVNFTASMLFLNYIIVRKVSGKYGKIKEKGFTFLKGSYP